MLFHISLNEIRLWGHHGVSEQERAIGSWYMITIDMDADIASSAYTDDELNGTVDYGRVAEVVKKEFCVSSRLLESLAWRIGRAVLSCSQKIECVTVCIQKQNPPVCSPTLSASVSITVKR